MQKHIGVDGNYPAQAFRSRSRSHHFTAVKGDKMDAINFDIAALGREIAENGGTNLADIE